MVVITSCATALLTVCHQPAHLPGNGHKSSPAISPQKQAASGVVTWRFRLCREKVLRQEDIFIAIPVEVTDTDAESRRHLSFDRQRTGFKMIASVNEDCRF